MKWYESRENLAILARYMHHRGYACRHFADALVNPDCWELPWQRAQLWWAHEQELQRRFNEDAAVILKS